MALRKSSLLDDGRSRYQWPTAVSVLAMLAVITIVILGIRETLRAEHIYSHHILYPLIVLIVPMAMIALIIEFAVRHKMSFEAAISGDLLRMAMTSGKSVGWDWDLKKERTVWFGDLPGVFGIPTEIRSGSSGNFRGFVHLVHQDDRNRVTEALGNARLHRSPYRDEFRLVSQDGRVRWVTAAGTFYYNKGGQPKRMLGVLVDITEQKEAHQSLTKSEERFSKAFRESPVALKLARARDHRYLDVNETFERITGWTRDEVIGQTPFDIGLWADPAQRDEYVKQALTDSGTRSLELRYRCKNGDERVGLASAELIEIDGETCILSAILDITDRKQAQEELHRKNAELAEAQRLAQLGSWHWDRKKRTLVWSEELSLIHGLDPKQPAPSEEELSHLFTPESWERLRNSAAQALKSGTVISVDLEVIRPDDSRRWITARIHALCASNGELISIKGTAQDITERKRAEDRLLEYEKVVETASEMIAVVDREFRFVIVNRAYVDQRNMTREELVGRHVSDVVGATVFKSIVKPKLDECFKGRVVKFEMKHTYPDLGERDLFLMYSPIEGPTGIERVVCILQDITDWKRIAGKLDDSEARLAGVVNSAMDAIIVVDEAQRIVVFNAAAEKMFGCPAGEAIGTEVGRFIPQRFRTKHRADIAQFGPIKLTHPSASTPGVLWALRADATEFPIEASISQLKADNKKLFPIIIRDITERRKAEAALRESEQRFRLLANQGPVLIWMSGTDKLCSYFNDPWLDFTGDNLEAQLRNGWAKRVHPDDRNDCVKAYSDAFDRREAFRLQYRLQRQDGTYRWMLNIGVPRFNPDGSFAGYVSSCIDVTEQKLAEEALASMGRRLIEAHEEERAWIGRELHDDINQRLALLAVELDRWSQQFSSTPQVSVHLQHAQQRVAEIITDVQGLSHRLHSSKLEYLGLVAAAKSFCKEIAEQTKAQVHFRQANVPRDLPKEIVLCLFRVLQESLQNAAKHSGAHVYEVDLNGDAEGIELKVTDDGVGFDQREAMKSKGIGLISMRERLQLVNGDFSVTSKVRHGTTIRAYVPFKADEYLALAG